MHRSHNQHLARKLGFFFAALLFYNAIFNNGSFFSSAFAIDNLPDIGNSSDAVISVEEEKQLGKEFMRNVRESLDLIDDPVSTEYIQNIGNRLASQIDSDEYDFTFFIVNDSTINAFAGPGGYIGVHSGLILATQSEDELVSVIAHEMAHVTQRHLVRSLTASSNMTLPAMAAIIAAILLGQGNGNITEAVIASTLAGSAQSQLNFSRLHEQEADRVGIDMMAKSGYDPMAMPYFFETLQKSHRYADGNVPEFILTHPVTSSRIADSKGRAEQYHRIHRTVEQTANYELIKARIYHLTKNDNKAAPQTAIQAPRKNDPFAKRYQYILELDAKRNYREAKQAIAELIKDDDTRLPYVVTQANIEMANEQWGNALEVLQKGLLIYPHSNHLLLLYTSALIHDNKAKEAMRVLENQFRNPKSPPDYYKIHAQAAEQAGLISEEFESLGEYQYRLGNLHTAIKQFQRALKENNNNQYRDLKLKARIEKLKQEVINNQPAKEGGTEKSGFLN